MPKMTISITAEVDPELSAHEFRLLLLDAVYEFKAHRGPTAKAYVDRRYPGTDVYRGEARDQKVRQVQRRNAAADSLHHAIWEATVVVNPSDPSDLL